VTPTWVLQAGAKACLTLLNNNPTDILWEMMDVEYVNNM
jgi:hypothetical protein